jgi:hypothetical protein
VLSSAVLLHVPPDQITAAADSLKAAARKLVVLREYTMPFSGSYLWGRDYGPLMAPWQVVYRETTDERDGRTAAELIAYAPTSDRND